MRLRSIVTALAICLLYATNPVAAQDWNRALRNYQEVIQGKKRLDQLSPAEQREVMTILRAVQSRGSSNDSSSCREAKERAESAANELSDYARKLRNCADAKNFSDDCSTEFRRTRSAFDDYETASSGVLSYCR